MTLHVSGIEFFHQRRSAGLNELLAQRQLLLAISDVLADNRIEVVDVVEIYVVELLSVGSDVARNGDVDEDQWAISTRLHHVFDVRAMQQRIRAAGRSHNYIDVCHRGEAVFESHSAATELRGQFDAVVE